MEDNSIVSALFETSETRAMMDRRPNSLRWSNLHLRRLLLPLAALLALDTSTTTMTMAFSTIQIPKTTINAMKRSPYSVSSMMQLPRRQQPTHNRAFVVQNDNVQDHDDDTTDVRMEEDEGDDRYIDEDINENDSEDIDDEFFTDAEQKANPPIDLPEGKPKGFYIVEQYSIPVDGFDAEIQSILDGSSLSTPIAGGTSATTTTGTLTSGVAANNDLVDTGDTDEDEDGPKTTIASHGVTRDDLIRLNIDSGKNVTLPIALMLLDPVEYPSFSRARKACRKGYILIHEGPLAKENVFDSDKCVRGRVRNRILPEDVIGKQVRMGGGFYPSESYQKPPFDLPVVYEDDHFAIVNKPPGVVVYSHRKGGHGTMTVRAALPFVLQPPKRGTHAILRRPMACHRLDRPTAGLLLIAKTKPAMVDVTRQFVSRNVKKTYMAIVNGIPDEPVETRLSTQEADGLGVDVLDYLDGDDSVSWQIIDYTLEEKSAVTIWRPIQYVKSLKARDGVLTLVELKPKTGRYHQLRRHMAWVRDCPLVGDSTYDGGGDAMQLRERGLFLCSNKVCLDHPYYNTKVGRNEWDALPDAEKWAGGKIRLSDDGSTVEMHVSMELPDKFDSFLSREGARETKFNSIEKE